MTQWTDEIAIRQLLYHYCHRIDHDRGESVGALWHPEGRLEVYYNIKGQVYQGREALTAWFRDDHKSGSGKMVECMHMRHSIFNPVITFTSDDRATIYAESCYHDYKDGKALFVPSFYQDEVVRRQNRWWFWVKRIRVWMMHSAPARLYRPETMCYRPGK